MSNQVRPVMDWAAAGEPTDEVIWWVPRIYDRYQAEVTLKPDSVSEFVLRVFDHDSDDVVVGEHDCNHVTFNPDGSLTESQESHFDNATAMLISASLPLQPRQYTVLVCVIDGSGKDAFSNTLSFGPYDRDTAAEANRRLTGVFGHGDVQVSTQVLADLNVALDPKLDDDFFLQLQKYVEGQEGE